MYYKDMVSPDYDKRIRLNMKALLATHFNNPNYPTQSVVDSFNHALKNTLPTLLVGNHTFSSKTVQDHSDQKTKLIEDYINISSIRFACPTRNGTSGSSSPETPQDCMNQRITYTFMVQAIMSQCRRCSRIDPDGSKHILSDEIVYEKRDESTGSMIYTELIPIPCMVGCMVCTTVQKPDASQHPAGDLPGYFVINGMLRTLVHVVQLLQSTPMYLKSANPRRSVRVEMRSEFRNKTRSTVLFFDSTKPMVYLSTSTFKKAGNKELLIPITIMFRALGFENDRDIMHTVMGTEYAKKSNAKLINIMCKIFNTKEDTFENENSEVVRVSDQKTAIQYLIKHMTRVVKKIATDDEATKTLNSRKEYMTCMKILTEELYPHQRGVDDDNPSLHAKGLYIGYLLRNLLETVVHKRSVSDRDSYRNKGVTGPGELTMMLIRDGMRNMLSELSKTKEKMLSPDKPFMNINVLDSIKSSQFDKINRDSFNTGTWGAGGGQRKAYMKGVSQQLGWMSYSDKISHIRRIMSLSENTNNSEQRYLHPSSYGIIDTCETPEGQKVGIVLTSTINSVRTVDRQSQRTIARDIFIKQISGQDPVVVVIVVGSKKAKINLTASKDELVLFLKDYSNKPVTVGGNTLSLKYPKTERVAGERMVHFVEIMRDRPVEPIIVINSLSFDQINMAKVMVNNAWIGVTNNAPIWVEYMRHLRHRFVLDRETSIVYRTDENELHVTTTGNRMARWLLTVKDNKIVLPIDEAVKEIESGAIVHFDQLVRRYPTAFDIIDVMEGEYCMVATNPSDLVRNADRESRVEPLKRGDNEIKQYTHIEFHGMCLFGMITNQVSFPTLNQAPRLTYSVQHIKQSISTEQTNMFIKEENVLCHGQRPISEPWLNRMIGIDKKPYGVNCIVAIASYTGFNQEDSLILNEDAIKRGMFSTIHLRTETEQIRRSASSVETEAFAKPDMSSTDDMHAPSTYRHLGPDGMVAPWTVLEKNDAIIGKRTPKVAGSMSDKPYTDSSVFLRKFTQATVESVRKLHYDDGAEGVVVKLYQRRDPQVGDKFSNRYAQKGVISKIIPQSDMPFTESGMVPDIIMNPHAIPSRMTMGQMVEMALNRVCVEEGRYGDATAFDHEDSKTIQQELKCRGFVKSGCEKMYCGITGRPIETEIFICPNYTMRLKHMVVDKVYSRARGPKTAKFRQPVEGRVRDGGQRFGEMERDCLLAHGTVKTLRERFMDDSDGHVFKICDMCGNYATNIPDRPECYECVVCDNRTYISTVNKPYATKVVKQTLESIGINMQFMTENSQFV